MAAAALAAAASVMPAGSAQSDKWWPGYGNGPDNSRYFASRQIDRANVSRLQVAWTYPHGDTGSVPIAVRGVIYGRGRNGSLVAIDAKTGAELWVRENMNGMTGRGINYWSSADGRDERLIFSMDSLLQEVDAKTGKSIMSFGRNGVVDLREGIDGRDPSTIGNIQSNTPGEVFENLIILGSATGEGYMSPPGDIRAYDVTSGRLVWTFHTVPRPGEFGYDTWPKEAYKYVGGNNNWGEMTIDTRRGIAYIPLGSPTYDFYGADRPGANLFGTSIVALDARTGKRLWHFQIVHHDLWDLDPSAAPQLTTIRHRGRNRDVVVVTAKTGWLYVFDRVTGEPIWPIEERPVPKSEMEGEQSWPTQPFPTNPPPFVKHTFGVEDISPHLSPDEADTIKRRLLAADNKGIFTPISLKDTVHVPTSNGGVLFGGTAARPGTAEIYVVAHENPGILRLLRPGEGRGGGPPPPPGQAVYQQQCQACHGPERLGTETGVPARAPGLRSGQQNRGGHAALRCRGDPHGARDRQGPDAGLSTPRRRRRRQSRGLLDGDGPGRDVRRPRPRRRSRGIRRAAVADCRIGIGIDASGHSGGSWTRRRAVSRGHARFRTLHDQRVQHGGKPRQAAVHEDREVRLESARHQVADRLRRRPRARRARHHRHRHARDRQQPHRDRVGTRLRRRTRQPDPCLEQRHRPSTLVVALRRQFPRLADHVRDGRPPVPRGPGGERGGRPRRRSTCRRRETPPLRRWAGWPTLFPSNSQPSAGPREGSPSIR